jgi:hypothetical protein
MLEWHDKPLEELIRYYKKNPNWCMERQFPRLEVLKAEADIPAIRDMGVYVDQHNLDLRPQEGSVLIFNNCSGFVLVEDWAVLRAYVSLDSKITFAVKDNAILIVDYYDNAIVEVINKGKERATIYRYGRQPPITSGDVRVVKKEKGDGKTV